MKHKCDVIDPMYCGGASVAELAGSNHLASGRRIRFCAAHKRNLERLCQEAGHPAPEWINVEQPSLL